MQDYWNSLSADMLFHGTLAKRYKLAGWILPANPAKLPLQVRAKMADMTAAKKTKAEENGNDDGTFDQDVLYVRMSDVAEGVVVEKGMELKFKVYIDEEGAGAYDVNLAC